MGLDMYLYKETYVWTDNPEQKGLSFKGLEKYNINPKRVKKIIEEVGYWRKANQIHQWFVDNVQDGQDECQLSYVSRDSLKELLKIISKILKKKSLARELLPTQEGFFFGGQDYDEYYFKDLKDTQKIIKAALKEPDMCDLYYQSSW